MKRECESCIKRKTTYCPTSMECMATDDMPYYQNRIMLLEENQELKKQLEDANEKIILLQASEPMLNYKKALEETQQKEFIKWLEKKQSSLRDEISELTSGMCNTDFQDTKIEVYEKVLQKYQEIIGASDETN